MEVLMWLRRGECPWDRSTCYAAADKGHLAILKWARENGCHWDAQVCLDAAAGGHLEVLRWARENGCPGGGRRMLGGSPVWQSPRPGVGAGERMSVE